MVTHADTGVTLPYIGYKFTKGRKSRYRKEIRKYGFASPETWDLNETASVWLYSHIKMMLDIGGEIVDFYYPFTLPEQEDKALAELGVPLPLRGSAGDIFDFICSLLEEAKATDDEDRSFKLTTTAFHIFAIMLPYAWW